MYKAEDGMRDLEGGRGPGEGDKERVFVYWKNSKEKRKRGGGGTAATTIMMGLKNFLFLIHI